MKKLLVLALMCALSLSVVACGSNESAEPEEATEAPAEEATEEPAEEESAESTSVMTVNGADEMVEVAVPADFSNGIVCLNYQTLDFVDAVGLGDLVVGIVGQESSLADHLQKYLTDESITVVGTGLKDIDMEAVASLAPSMIFTSDRTASFYDDYLAIAPVYCAYVDYTFGDTFMDGYIELANNHAKIFGVEDAVGEIIAGYEERIAAIAEVANGQTCMIGLATEGQVTVLGDEGRCSIIPRDMGFTNVKNDSDVNHGEEASYETFLEEDPEWIFIIDKDLAVAAEGASLAQDLMDNEVIHQTQAHINDQIVYLTPGNIWYQNDGAITGLDQMIACIEEAVGMQ